MNSKIAKISTIAILTVLITGLSFLPWILVKKNIINSNWLARLFQNSSGFNNLKEALYYESSASGDARCTLCPNKCLLVEKGIGLCRARQNVGGKIYSLSYGKNAAGETSSVEKTEFFHLLPGAIAFQNGTAGCNFSCKYCPVSNLSQNFPEKVSFNAKTPKELVAEAKDSGAEIFVLGTTEPLIAYEYSLEIAQEARAQGLKVAIISNGFINSEPLKNILPYLDAVKIELKGFQNDHYQLLAKGQLGPILESLKTIKESGKLLEISYETVEGENDSVKEVSAMLSWVKENLGIDTPLHFPRLLPAYLLASRPAISEEEIKSMREMALAAGFKYVYAEGLSYDDGETTYCADSTIAIRRQGSQVVEDNLKDGACADGTAIPGIWK
jgi:pyruvate formate lyase activating enzyme